MTPTFPAMAAGYRNMWRDMTVTRAAECEAAARRILAGRARYQAVERQTGVPWFFIGLLHMRESSCNFAGVLHNGEHIIGKGTRTRLVPAGRGPFAAWEEAAIDALRLKGLHAIRDWPIERIGYESERFNGFGYIRRGVNSPYVWAGSNHYTRGKYVRDGVFDPAHVDTQLGTLPVLRALCRLDSTIAERVTGRPKPVPEIAVGTGAAGAVVAAGARSGWGALEWTFAIAAAAIAVAIAIALIRAWRRRKPADLPPIEVNETATAERAGAAEEGETA
ncbi:hypothetical protein [Pseudorhodoplanes sp.]|uniref:hypothetical protein n=1 Tax=Pseudorhodoplanes sp. TaxID=1934341 RepID=UPI003919C2D2